MVEQQKSGLTTIPLFRGRIIDPSYNNTPDYSNQLRVTASYLLSSQTLLFLEYLRFESERDSVRHLINDSETVLDYGEREGAWDHILASVTTSFTPEISLTMSWFYQRWKVQQDLAYRWWQGADFVVPYVEHGVPYQDISNSLSLSLQFMPQEDLTFIAGVSYVITDGESGLGDSLTDAPFALSSFSEMEAEETVFSFDVIKRIDKEWEVGLRTWLDIYDDKAYGLLDGKVVTTTLGIKRYF